MCNKNLASKKRQRGLAALTVVMLLMLGATLGVIYLNRSVIFEQKIAANHLRSKVALEMADAGVDWAIGMLNYKQLIDNSCQSLVEAPEEAKSFRGKYLLTKLDPASQRSMQPNENLLPGCKLELKDTGGGNYENKLLCKCPDPAGNKIVFPEFDEGKLDFNPGFTVQFSRLSEAQDPNGESVRIISTGCAAKSGACAFGKKDVEDATATVSVIVKTYEKDPSTTGLTQPRPSVPLTCGVACVLLNLGNLTTGQKLRIINQDPGSGGMLINAGLLSIPGGTNILGLNQTLTSVFDAVQGITGILGLNLLGDLITLPGKSPLNLIVAPDYSLLGDGLQDLLLSQNTTGLLSFVGSTVVNVVSGVGNTLTDLLQYDNVGVNLLQCQRSGVFKKYFGVDLSVYIDPAKTPTTRILPQCGAGAAACGVALKRAYAEGWRSFYFPEGISLNRDSKLAVGATGGPEIGSPADPVTFVTNKKLNLSDDVTVHGLVFSNSGVAADVSLTGANIHGALINCGLYVNTGFGDIMYSAKAISSLGNGEKDLARVAGTWTDRCKVRLGSSNVWTRESCSGGE